RGYSLVVLFTLGLGFLGARFARSPSFPGAAALSVLAALALWTMPTALYPVAGMACWIALLLLLRGEGIGSVLRLFVLPFGAMTALFTFGLYTPVILVTNGVRPIVSHPAVRTETWPDFLRGLRPPFPDALSDFGRDVPAPAAAALVALLAAGLASAVVRRNWPVALLLPAALAGCLAIFAAHPALPFPRTWIYFIPLLLVLARGRLPGLRFAAPVLPPAMGGGRGPRRRRRAGLRSGLAQRRRALPRHRKLPRSRGGGGLSRPEAGVERSGPGIHPGGLADRVLPVAARRGFRRAARRISGWNRLFRREEERPRDPRPHAPARREDLQFGGRRRLSAAGAVIFIRPRRRLTRALRRNAGRCRAAAPPRSAFG